MEESQSFFKNKPLNETLTKNLQNSMEKDEKLIFVIICDLNLKGKYDETALAVTDKRFIVLDQTVLNGSTAFGFDEINEISVKRMYGNARLNIITKQNEKRQVMRFSYAVATLCEMAASFIGNMAEGGDLALETEVAENAFEKLSLMCPKCGRTLIRQGAECIKCSSKSKIAGKLLKYIKPEKKILIICLVFSVITTAMALLPPQITKLMVDDIIPGGNKKMLMYVVILLLLSYVVQYTIGAIRGYMLRISGDRIVMSLRNDIYYKAQFLPMKFYDKTSTGSVINRISGDTSTIQAFILRITQEVVVQFFLLIGIIIIMFVMDWKLTLLSLIPVPLVVLGAKLFSNKISPFYRRIWRRWSAVTSILTDTIPCIRVIKSFAGEKRAVKKFEKYNEEWMKVDVQSAKITTVFPNIVNFAVTCGTLLIWSIGGSQVINSNGAGLSVGLLVAFINYASMFYGPVNFFAYLSDSYQGALAAAERVFDILDAEPEHVSDNGLRPETIKGKVEFRNVSFSFDKTKKVLNDINLTIKPGDTVGIVGTTGSGKSTLINLLMQFYTAYEGNIFIDDINVKDIDTEYFRSCIGYVQQEPMMFSDTIYNNISYGVPNAPVEAVIHAADVANAHEFIVKQPDAYDSMLGERGVGLSGGEKQRLSIARAVLKNPSILIFDEATAAVDSETESHIQEAIDRLIYGRTTLMIAHRLSTLRKANVIIVVDQGTIIECGSHRELMEQKGKYFKLIEIQSMSEQLRRDKEEARFE